MGHLLVNYLRWGLRPIRRLPTVPRKYLLVTALTVVSRSQPSACNTSPEWRRQAGSGHVSPRGATARTKDVWRLSLETAVRMSNHVRTANQQRHIMGIAADVTVYCIPVVLDGGVQRRTLAAACSSSSERHSWPAVGRSTPHAITEQQSSRAGPGRCFDGPSATPCSLRQRMRRRVVTAVDATYVGRNPNVYRPITQTGSKRKLLS